MANTNNEAQKLQENKKSVPIGLIAVTIILAGVLIFLVVMYFDQRKKMLTKLIIQADMLQLQLELH